MARFSPASVLCALCVPAAMTLAAPASARPLSLGEALRLARSQAFAVRSARAQTAVADSKVPAARAPALPSASVTLDGTLVRLDGKYYYDGLVEPAQTQTSLYGDATLNAQWQIFDFGRVSAGIDSARRGGDAARFDEKSAERQVMETAAAAYFTLAADEDLVLETQQMLQQREHALQITQGLVRSGARSPVEEVRAQVSRDVARFELVKATGKRRADAESLSASLGLPPGETLEAARPGPSSLPGIPSAENAEARAVAGRPELRAADARIAQNRRALDQSKAGHLPTLAIQGSALFRSSTFLDAPVTGRSFTGSGMLVLTVPIFDPTVNARVDGAEALAAAARTDLQAAEFQIRHECAQAVIGVQTAEATLAAAESAAQGASATLASMEVRYAAGVAGPLDLLDAQQVDRDARLHRIDARLALDVARVRLLSATGSIERLASAG